mmetsp:Transcript_8099/g.9254  ORF Transcript_8099/g.9254 Transcript_8099/m.9254 type:complete len:229 (+) Transcript_8099:24-710(+)
MKLFTLGRCVFKIILFGLFSIGFAAESSTDLTNENYHEETLGKTVFLKFYSPSCDHCKELAPKWDLMAREWVNHEQGLVGAIDCTKETKFCDEMKLTGLPTLLYGEPSEKGALLEEYPNEKTYEALSEFANSTLSKVICSPVNLDACNESDRKKMEHFLSVEMEELDTIIKDKEDSVSEAQNQFQVAFDDLQKSYYQLSTENEIKKSKIKFKIKVLKSIKKISPTTKS